MKIHIHTLAHGATVITLSLHGFKFSDGTECPGQDPELVQRFNMMREIVPIRILKGMAIKQSSLTLSREQQAQLYQLSAEADIVLAPLPMILALKELGIREEYPNVVAFNATAETARSSPTEKVVDIDNWSF